VAKVPTIAIVWPSNKRGGFVHINLSDFDPSVHQVYDPNAPRPEPPSDVAVNPVTPGPAADTDVVVVPEPSSLVSPDANPAPTEAVAPGPARKRAKK
jgi:hypothetical protein